ncbi:MAG: hypothetical protein LC641_01870 [Spirochaeta sp.]|nr:hypothetical protein [Spirochaeta sp.]
MKNPKAMRRFGVYENLLDTDIIGKPPIIHKFSTPIRRDAKNMIQLMGSLSFGLKAYDKVYRGLVAVHGEAFDQVFRDALINGGME